MRSRTRHLIGFAMAVLLLLALPIPVGADTPSVEGTATFTDYPEDYAAGIYWDIWRVKVNASEPDHGTLRIWNPYNDWNHVRSMDPAILGLPPDTDMKEIAKMLKDQVKEIWIKVDVACVNIIDNRAVVGGQVAKAGDIWIEHGLLGSWLGIEFFDMSADPLHDDYTESIVSDPDGDEGLVTEEMVMDWCEAGDVPVPPDWFYYQTELVSGDIVVTG